MRVCDNLDVRLHRLRLRRPPGQTDGAAVRGRLPAAVPERARRREFVHCGRGLRRLAGPLVGQAPQRRLPRMAESPRHDRPGGTGGLFQAGGEDYAVFASLTPTLIARKLPAGWLREKLLPAQKQATGYAQAIIPRVEDQPGRWLRPADEEGNIPISAEGFEDLFAVTGVELEALPFADAFGREIHELARAAAHAASCGRPLHLHQSELSRVARVRVISWACGPAGWVSGWESSSWRAGAAAARRTWRSRDSADRGGGDRGQGGLHPRRPMRSRHRHLQWRRRRRRQRQRRRGTDGQLHAQRSSRSPTTTASRRERRHRRSPDLAAPTAEQTDMLEMCFDMLAARACVTQAEPMRWRVGARRATRRRPKSSRRHARSWRSPRPAARRMRGPTLLLALCAASV